VPLLGRIAGVDGHRARFNDDLAASVAFGDARWEDTRRMLRERLPAKGYRVPELPVPPPFRYTPITDIDLRDFGAVIFTSGYRPDFSWIDFPICDELGYPITASGASPHMPGLYFCGIHFMRIRRSGFLYGVGEDAAILAEAIAANERRHTETAASGTPRVTVTILLPPAHWVDGRCLEALTLKRFPPTGHCEAPHSFPSGRRVCRQPTDLAQQREWRRDRRAVAVSREDYCLARSTNAASSGSGPVHWQSC
jgi:hypothetical protein